MERTEALTAFLKASGYTVENNDRELVVSVDDNEFHISKAKISSVLDQIDEQVFNILLENDTQKYWKDVEALFGMPKD
ncbi:hypothetical protein [Catenisphaera adipataccumulans]|uniref:Uncharacterized protein n=1 Tax=Catenisphaera adipataccumulans TaxID=700500 RepID=A0A7W8CX18_9FIRM|nr:hypothetical protein [Catenisphaera adipataccumulans]MBB5182043.1 hypothetical protein [Catenisphaera adipataccumulans]